MTFYLENADLWDIVNDDLPPVDQRTAAWNRQNTRALGTIYTNCLPEQQALINDCKTAKDAWDTLSRIFSQSSTMAINRLLDELNDISLSNGEKISYYIARGKGHQCNHWTPMPLSPHLTLSQMMNCGNIGIRQWWQCKIPRLPLLLLLPFRLHPPVLANGSSTVGVLTIIPLPDISSVISNLLTSSIS